MNDPRQLYLDLMKKVLTQIIMDEPPWPIDGRFLKRRPLHKRFLAPMLVRIFRRFGIQLGRISHVDREKRKRGWDFPLLADTMIGLSGLDNLQFCIENVLANRVPGDLIETGVWRGGATIFMRATLKVYGVTDRKVWVADSFEGLPPPNEEKYPADAGDRHHTMDFLRISLDQVKANFAKYDLLDDQVHFLKGWFKDTLPSAPIEKLAVMRLDGDMYESTMDSLVHLYPRLSSGGYVIIDDYNLKGCHQAVLDFRAAKGINDEIKSVDGARAYWQRT